MICKKLSKLQGSPDGEPFFIPGLWVSGLYFRHFVSVMGLCVFSAIYFLCFRLVERHSQERCLFNLPIQIADACIGIFFGNVLFLL
jgi:hypothetical protein